MRRAHSTMEKNKASMRYLFPPAFLFSPCFLMSSWSIIPALFWKVEKFTLSTQRVDLIRYLLHIFLLITNLLLDARILSFKGLSGKKKNPWQKLGRLARKKWEKNKENVEAGGKRNLVYYFHFYFNWFKIISLFQSTFHHIFV